MKTLLVNFEGVVCQRDKTIPLMNRQMLPNARRGLKLLEQKNYKVIVLTSRRDLDSVKRWLNLWGFSHLNITNTKPDCDLIISDKALTFTEWSDEFLQKIDSLTSSEQ